MRSTCLRPSCDSEVFGVGVCFNCANSAYRPKREGVEAPDGEGGTFVTEGWSQQ